MEQQRIGVLVRMEPELRQQLERRASQNDRSMSAELVHLFKRSLEKPSPEPSR
jgi:Arc-like DNA binding domain